MVLYDWKVMAPNQLDILAAKSNYRILKKNLIQKTRY